MRFFDKRLAGWATLAAALAIAGCQQPTDEQPRQNAVEAPPPSSPLPAVEPPMDRAGLLARVAQAASAAALGQDDRAGQRELDGQAVELRLRFGCKADLGTAGAKAFSIRFDEADRTLRLRAAPTLTLDDPVVAGAAGDGVEAVEGFWLPRPWLLAASCPMVSPQSPEPAAVDSTLDEAKQKPAARESKPAAAPPAFQRIGIGRFFTDRDSRMGRRDGRAYEAVSILAADNSPSELGYDLVLAGRLRQGPDGRVILCRPVSANAPPDCIVSADIDHVAVEDPRTRTVLANWSN
ncbi:hypothetical protein G7078_09660 [Sphingomonas sinipercae]|uniref:Lipoprotein n=1 Tax=Sphingomonas sinipercae TaxID=2714944 RepID=A0A6G7ZQ16_9SPHN|nr:hypothetical protein [Sphingomonas sinipercae]QIL03012.1 hypothetical protein G7078_09660 [Sphingomonas sinipercae]